PADPTTGRPAGAAASGPAPGADGLLWYTLGADEVLRAQQVDGQRGLSPAEAASRAQRFGPK
ncbi:MAG TPA: cation-transporting P-type ATPase, partial [Streptosporangiaceae bacterium]|nr:cation-transporting P-type ATPase [Streptosporangiaceae bacterium]